MFLPAGQRSTHPTRASSTHPPHVASAGRTVPEVTRLEPAAAFGGARYRAAMDDPPRCEGCSEPLREDQTVLRLSIGTMRDDVFSHLLMRPDVYLHAGWPSTAAWGDEPPGEPSDERWCATRENIQRATAALALHGATGASGRYAGE